MKFESVNKFSAPVALGTFYPDVSKNGEGVVAGPHEGFVGIDKIGKMYKLVDRSYFSRINFNKERIP